MGQKLDKFLLLMWKNFLLQWRHPKQTVVEILAPVLFASLLVVTRSLVEPEPYSAKLYTPFDPQIPSWRTLKTFTIPWAPNTSFFDNVMERAGKALNEHNVACENNVTFSMKGFDTIQELEKFLQDQNNLAITFAGVQFNEAESTNMDVRIRFPAELSSDKKKNWLTNFLFPAYQVAGPREWKKNEGAEPSYSGEGFLKLQKEISLSIIKELNPNFTPNALNIQMQRFNYPRWMQDVLLEGLQAFIGLIFMLSFVYTCISTVKVITTEKEKQLKEAMKIMGLPGWLHWTAWFIKTFLFLLITVIIIVVMLKARWYPDTSYTIFTYSDPVVIFLFMILYMCATITFCFAISVFFTKANTAATVAGMVWFVSYFPYSLMQEKYDTLSLAQKLLSSLLSNTAMAYGFQLVIMFEGTEEGVQWNNLWSSTTPDDTLVLGHLMIMLAVDAIIYLLVALYVEAVFPGEYGVPEVWYFPFTKAYWRGTSNVPEVDDLHDKTIENEFYEKEPSHLHAGVRIKHLRKQFANKKIAVHDLCLNMYEDQITVLLGHNGAGKTTTMSMLTGMFPPSSGTAIIGGHDIRTDIGGVRSSLGLCPQHNILFDELTVKEHLYFYCRLKGMKKADTDQEIKKYVELLELVPKANAPSETLSGGMKRKLSVGVALCGGSSVVMFDEPTAGMDPAARRALWDLLQSQKKGRTMLLTTHFMDEADLLGDRIAIMAEGNLQCCGSSFFLKKKFGAGYHLIMDKSSKCNVIQVTSLLQKYIPDIQVESNIGSELTYVLSEEQSSIFEKMLSDLETHSASLGVSSYGISLTTLEEVFMKVGASHSLDEAYLNKTTDKEILTNGNSATFSLHSSDATLDLGSEKLLTGFALWRNQILAMLMKRSLSILRSWVLLLIQNFIPVLFLTLTVVIVRKVGILQDLPSLKMDLDSYADPITVLTHAKPNPYADNYVDFLSKSGKTYIDWGVENMTDKMLVETEQETSAVRMRYIVGATFEDDSIVAWFNNEPFHSPALALQLVMNAVLQKEAPGNSTQIYNHPLPYTIETRLNKLQEGQDMGFQISFNLGFSFAFVSAFYIMFYIRERVVKAKHLQFVSGVEVLTFWFSSFICDLAMFLVTSLIVLITLAILQEDGFSSPGDLGRIFSVLLYFGFSMLPMMYLAAYIFDVPSTGYTRMALINIFTGVAGFMTVQILSQPVLDLKHVADPMHWVLLLVPHYSFSSGIQDMNVIHSTHALCDQFLSTSCGNIPKEWCKKGLCLLYPDCCTMTTNYYDIEAPGIGRNVIFSCCIGAILIAILILIEYRAFDAILYKIRRNRLPLPPTSAIREDTDVLAEKQKIRDCSMEEIAKYDLVLKDVTKYYDKFLAVNDLCLGINRFECFGLLGVNGAGKTTTFKMMTGDVKLSSGDAWISGLSLRTDMKKIHQLIGYCPQFDALLDDLTCRETLIIFGLLRGITLTESKLEAIKLAREFDFYQHMDKKVNELSGGNKRKLSTAIALIGDPLIIYLDEPTTGMDPATKRYLWNALCKIRDSGKCLVLTSHSMEECEALCTRIAIMVNGTFMCLGSTQHLKSTFSEGYTLTIKTRKSGSGEDVQDSELEPIQRFVEQNFPRAVVREKHQELITFYIADKTYPWSKMFGIMEQNKSSLNIEDYSLGQSSLEQVFLSFTKYQRDETT